MALVKSRNGDSPTVRNLFNDMFDLDRFFEGDSFFRGMQRTQMPSVNISETDSEFKVEVAAPGLKKEDLKINLTNDMLTISAEREEEKNTEEKNYTRREFNYQTFQRSFSLPATANAEGISAEYKDGILHLMIPKREEAKQKTKQIQIS